MSGERVKTMARGGAWVVPMMVWAGCFGAGHFPVIKGATADAVDVAAHPHAVLEHTAPLPGVSAAEAFHLVEYMSLFYTQTSGDHRRFALADGSPRMSLGAVVDCREERGGLVASHQYHVTRFEPGRYVRLVSDPSTVKAGPWNVPVGVVAEYIVDPGASPVTFTTRVTLVFGNDFAYRQARDHYHALAIFGAHVREETEGALRVLRSRDFQAHALINAR